MKRNRKGAYSYNPRRRRGHRRARRNPAVLGVALPPMHMIAYGAGGFIAPPMIEGWANQFLPASLTGSVLGRYAVKIGAVLGLTYLVKTLLSAKEAFPVALGGSLYVVVSAVNEFVPQLIPHPAPAPTTQVQAYRTGMIKAYRTGMIGTGVNGYVNLAQSRPGLARVPSDMMPAFNINQTGISNPTWADPRFTQSPFASR